MEESVLAAMHADLSERYGGAPDLRDPGLLDAALRTIRSSTATGARG